jgi:hypothetical protein
VNFPAKPSIVLTRDEAFRRHIEAAIIAFEEERYDVAITLAGAAEGMVPETTGPAPALFLLLRDHPTAAGKKNWIKKLNAARNWLKHAAEPNHPPNMKFDRREAVIMLVRAISKDQTAALQSEAIKNVTSWIKEHFDEVFPGFSLSG